MIRAGWILICLVLMLTPGVIASDAVNHYDVLRNGKKIGDHQIRFSAEGETLRVVSETNMKVKFLFITAYRYHYVSEEIWRGGQLVSVETTVNDNGERVRTRIEGEGNVYLATDADGNTATIEQAFYPTNHWNVGASAARTLYNTITGRLNEVEITSTGNQLPQPYAFELSVRGDLDIDTRYDVFGNWLGMSFCHSDGSLIEFQCTDCRNTLEVPS